MAPSLLSTPRPYQEEGADYYRPTDTETWFVSDQRTIVVEDFFAPDPDSYVGLLRFLLGLDLIDRVVFWMLPVDDPLPWLLVDRRAARVTATHDETWLRVVDVEQTLAARRYTGDGMVTIAVDAMGGDKIDGTDHLILREDDVLAVLD